MNRSNPASEPSIPPSGEAPLPPAIHTQGNPTVELRGQIDLSKMTITEVLDIKRQLIELGLMGRFSQSKHKVAAETIWDWSKSNSDIARANCVSVYSVASWRKKLAKPPAPRDYAALPKADSSSPRDSEKIDYDSLDWSKPDVVLAREIGRTRERVRQKRAELGKPKMLATHFQFNAFRDAFAGVIELKFSDARKKFPQMALATFHSYCNRLNIQRIKGTKSSVYPWDKLNWNLPNKLLGEIWGINAHRVAMQRCNRQRSKPGFRVIDRGNVRSAIPDNFTSVIEAEKQKAQAV